MKIALASAPVVTGDIRHNTDAILRAVEQCRGKAELVVFGESVLQGFDSLRWDYETDQHTAVPLMDASIRRIRRAAKENGIAVSFGFIQRGEDVLYSSQIFIGADGGIETVFHRVSVGWKYHSITDGHYREGERFEKFHYGGKSFAIGLCGDLWTDGRPEEMKALNANIVLWPVWCDYKADEWNNNIKREYAEQAALCGKDVLLVNPFCADPDAVDCAAGAGVHFRDGKIVAESPSGGPGLLYVEVE